MPASMIRFPLKPTGEIRYGRVVEATSIVEGRVFVILDEERSLKLWSLLNHRFG